MCAAFRCAPPRTITELVQIAVPWIYFIGPYDFESALLKSHIQKTAARKERKHWDLGRSQLSCQGTLQFSFVGSHDIQSARDSYALLGRRCALNVSINFRSAPFPAARIASS